MGLDYVSGGLPGWVRDTVRVGITGGFRVREKMKMKEEFLTSVLFGQQINYKSLYKYTRMARAKME